ncbi:T-cell surface antigen CD2-like [Pelmatolapia mariae]|uniref:T-cell surface antigen CD2-like n=1 Tax=Pelmatolapia mariae TaxID=158779 RepID=UPI002FE6360F
MRTAKKKMASAATIAVFLLCCFITASTGSQDDCVYAATGSSFTVSLRYKLKESDRLKWFKDARVVFYRRGKQVILGKNNDVDSTGSLKLTQLTKDMSGRYRPEVTNEDGINVGNLPSMHLCVLDRVQKPKVTMTCTGDKTKVSFTCSVGQNDKIQWFMDGKQLAEKGKTVMRVAKDVANAHFSCNVSNPVSSEISLPVQQICYKPIFSETIFGISIWVLVGGGAGIVLMLILIVIVCCIRIRRKKHVRLNDERELYLQWSNQEQEQPDYYDHRYLQQLPGNTSNMAENSNSPSNIPKPGICTHCGLKRDGLK